MNELSMHPRVQIIGAGIGGLSLGACLKHKGIPVKLFDRGAKVNGHNYGITIWPSAYQELLPTLRSPTDSASFRRQVAVDQLLEGLGKQLGRDAASGPNSDLDQDDQPFKASDSLLRDALAQGQDISWQHRVTGCVPSASGLRLEFENGSSSTAPVTVDASGLTSPILSSLLPSLRPEVLPYAVYHGTRYMLWPQCRDQIRDLFPGETNDYTVQIQQAPVTYHIHLSRASILPPSLPTVVTSRLAPKHDDIIIEIRYTISRPARPSTESDPLFNPSRARSAATETPDEFYSEVSTLCSSQSWSRSQISFPSGFPSPDAASTMQALQHFLAPSVIKQNHDRILNWLMRLTVPSPADLDTLARLGVVLMGDAAHRLPILGSRGACLAMTDAGQVSNWVQRLVGAEDLQGPDVEAAVRSYYRAVHASWASEAAQGIGRLGMMHGLDDPDAGYKL